MSEMMLLASRIRTPGKFLFLAILLAVLAGCAAAGKPKPEPVAVPAAKVEPAPPTGPSVVRLADGREGFRIVEIPGMDAESRRDFEQAVAAMRDREYRKAIGLLEKVIGKSPGVTAPYINLAIAYRHMDQPDLAEPHLKRALELIPEHPVASNEYGLLLRKAGRFAEARTIYEKALATFPDYQPVHRNLGILCDLYLNDPACALEHYAIYSEAMPEDAQVMIWIADLSVRMGRQ